ncbi:VWA domain-containing protein [Nannocystis sp.]|uniref:vWA domain-containing protein n=1 Tax=Nannocystis sp. TaxID=1962667 RepID=UPI0024274F94|nr:VWA domain-containing protein [Nannocystis sp.]MBK7829921.1 VWA domain-containing protein [Nannocystis sp.]MBK9757815.1 VWA domain-containing protein [Nannocystis sp.]
MNSSPFSLCVLALLLACGDSGRGNADATSVTGVTGVTSITITDPSGDPTGDPTTITGATDSGTSDSSPTSAGPGGDDSGTGSGSSCSGDGDCPPGEHCTPWTGVCVNANGCLVDEDCDPGFKCDGGTCEIGGCGASSFNLTVVPPNVMIVLDRSGSMDGDVQDSNKNRWEVAKDAIDQLVNTFNTDIRFGLVTYSGCVPGQECSAGKIAVPLGNQNAGPITGFLADKGLLYLCNSGKPETSTGNTLYALIGEDSLQDPERGNAVLLITDGGENNECQTVTNGADAAGKLLSQTISVKTFVVGFSDQAIGSLKGIAEAGGTADPFNANNPASLEAALNTIAGAVASCTFKLDSVPEDPSKIYVFFDDDPAGIPVDLANGWTYDPVTNTVTFHGASCQAIQDGTVVDVDVVFGCNVPVPG